MKGAFVTVVVILVLSLAVWSAFYAMAEPLESDDTKIVVGIIAGIVLFAKWVWGRVRKKEVKDDQKT